MTNTLTRHMGEVREHYLIEKELADRLRAATREERRVLYGQVYDELYRRVPKHPQLTHKVTPAERDRVIRAQMRLLTDFLHPEDVFLEVGAGDCALSFAVAPRVKWAYGLDVSAAVSAAASTPANFTLILSDGSTIRLPAGSVNLAYSFQLMEHLHPEDAQDQLRNILQVLAPGGQYICVTPNRLNGPHDVSVFFDERASGFHLREYSWAELSDIFISAGFKRTTAYVGLTGRFFRVPMGLLRAFESVWGVFPARWRRVIGSLTPFKQVLSINLVGTK